MVKYGAVIDSIYSRELAEYLWKLDTDGTAWEYVFFLARIHATNYSTDLLNPGLGRKPRDNWQGLTVLHVKDDPAFQELMEAPGAASLLRNTPQVSDLEWVFHAGSSAATSCMPSLLARSLSWRTTRSRYRSS